MLVLEYMNTLGRLHINELEHINLNTTYNYQYYFIKATDIEVFKFAKCFDYEYEYEYNSKNTINMLIIALRVMFKRFFLYLI